MLAKGGARSWCSTMMEHGACSLLMGTEKRIFNHILVSYLRPALLHRILPFVFVSYLPIASRAASFDSLAAACNSTLFHEVNVVPLRSSLRYFSIRRSFS